MVMNGCSAVATISWPRAVRRRHTGFTPLRMTRSTLRFLKRRSASHASVLSSRACPRMTSSMVNHLPVSASTTRVSPTTHSGNPYSPKPKYLIEYLMREALRVAALAHAVDQLALKRLQAALALPGRHRAAQPVRLAGGKSGRDDRQLHDLLLENGHPQGALEHRLDGLARIAHRLLAVAAAQVRMHHLALNRTGAYDRHLDDEIVDNCAAASAAAWPSAPATRFETRRWCPRGRSCRTPTHPRSAPSRD